MFTYIVILHQNWTDVVSFLRKHDKLLSSALAKKQQHTNIQLGFDALRGYLEERGTVEIRRDMEGKIS
jgi:hypothetical protein